MAVPLRDSWSLIIGVSGGMGAATARALADQGGNVVGVHFDTAEGQEAATKLADELRNVGVQAHFFNLNAASVATRTEVVSRIGALSAGAGVRVFVHSVAFGTLLPFLPGPDGAAAITPRQLAMTVDVMGHNLVYWTQDLLAAGLLPRGAKIYGLTSAGSTRVLPSYGAVSAAKCVLESHIRQLAVELAPYGVAANALRAGTTITPALLKIPNSGEYADLSRERNPHLRLTEPEDVAEAIIALSATNSSWITGNVIGVDGGEIIVA